MFAYASVYYFSDSDSHWKVSRCIVVVSPILSILYVHGLQAFRSTLVPAWMWQESLELMRH